MPQQASDIQRLLADQDDEFKRWNQEHHRYEDRLTELAGKSQLTAEEEVEEKELKKRKLFLKDQMAARMRGFEMSRT